ncbi:unnamed protein product [Rhizoctonia solani]|uniref:GH16 domain-containing protein n=1 Tax=Rhizoctonia solani TaxID=456999 RepID=A0A8H3HZW1_9AGAM|nr:unnamed protein product [Rhizoctonia solani]
MLYFARDPLGQRSLLLHLPTAEEPILLLCSASNHRDAEYEEISTSGIYSISLKGTVFECAKTLACNPRDKSVFDGWKTLNRTIPSEVSSPISTEQVEDFISRLDDSVRSRVASIPSNNADLPRSEVPVARLGVLFSGGIDSSIVAYLADRHIPRDEPIDLLNVGFENPRTLGVPQNKALQAAKVQKKRTKKERKKGLYAPETPLTISTPVTNEIKTAGTYDVPDRLTGLQQLEELRRLCPHRKWNFVCVNVPYEECKQEEPKVMALMNPSNTVMDLLQLDLDRLPSRNLGRDDRVISANGRESRYPFLSLVLVSYLAQLPVQIKVDPRLMIQKEGRAHTHASEKYPAYEEDPTKGAVDYQSRENAQANGLIGINAAGNAIMRIENTTQVTGNRKSVRISSKYIMNGGLAILDAVHMPYGCSTWPSWWTTDVPHWPYNGEIDILEGVNGYTRNQASLHANSGCTIPTNYGSTGTLVASTNCAAYETGNQGCGQLGTASNGYGKPFNDNGGGVYAMLWQSTGVSVYFFPRDAIPSDITSGAPQPSTWGTPSGNWPNTSCDPATYLKNHQIIFTSTICGEWAGSSGSWTAAGVGGQTDSCSASTGVSNCLDYVRNNGAAFTDAYWEVKSVKVYTT